MKRVEVTSILKNMMEFVLRRHV